MMIAAAACTPRPPARAPTERPAPPPLTATAAPIIGASGDGAAEDRERRSARSSEDEITDPEALKRLPPAERVRRLAELLVSARLLGDAEARQALWGALGVDEDRRGEEATREVLELLEMEAKGAGATALADLFAVDRAELDGREGPAELARRRREAASRGRTEAGIALLSQYASCARALYDAVVAQPSERAVIANHCWYIIDDRAAAPWLSADAARRPPDPPWRRYWEKLDMLLEETRRVAPRLHPVTVALGERQMRLYQHVDREGLEPPDLATMKRKLPAAPAGLRLAPYDRMPWLHVDDDLVVFGRARYNLRDHELEARMDRAVGGDPVRRVALFATGSTSADALDMIRIPLQALGVGSLEIALAAPASPASSESPASRTASESSASRAASESPASPGSPVVLLPFDLPGATSPRGRPRSVAAETTPLALVVRPEGFAFRAPDGDVSFPAAEIDARLADLLVAFPDAGRLAVAVDPTASFRSVVAAAAASLRRYPHLALVELPAAPRAERFAARLARRVTATVRVTDAAGRTVDGADWLRRCYLDALDHTPTLAGTLRIPDDTPAETEYLPGAALDDPDLRACLTRRARALSGARPPLTVELLPR